MTGYDYEYVVASYLRKQGFTGVQVTKGSGDFGVDVIAQKGRQKFAVQCKLYSYPVGVDAVQQVVTGMAMYGCNRAMVVINNTFTKAAEKLAEANNVVLLPNVLANGHRRWTKWKVIAFAVYLFYASVLTYASVQSFLYENLSINGFLGVVSTVLIASFPLWILPIIKLSIKKIKLCFPKIREYISNRKSKKND